MGRDAHEHHQPTPDAADGGVAYTVFDPCAVQISVQETTGNRRALLLKLVDRALLPDAERVKK